MATVRHVDGEVIRYIPCIHSNRTIGNLKEPQQIPTSRLRGQTAPVNVNNPKPHWKGPAPIPDPEVRARPRGGIQWQCPDCGNLHSQDKAFWRRAQIRCGRLGCQHKFRVGVGFGTYGCKFMGPWVLNTANRINPDYQSALAGSLFGIIDWECPKCSYIQMSDADFHYPTVQCVACKCEWTIGLLLYRPAGSKVLCPYDWAVHVPEANITISPPSLS